MIHNRPTHTHSHTPDIQTDAIERRLPILRNYYCTVPVTLLYSAPCVYALFGLGQGVDLVSPRCPAALMSNNPIGNISRYHPPRTSHRTRAAPPSRDNSPRRITCSSDTKDAKHLSRVTFRSYSVPLMSKFPGEVFAITGWRGVMSDVLIELSWSVWMPVFYQRPRLVLRYKTVLSIRKCILD